MIVKKFNGGDGTLFVLDFTTVSAVRPLYYGGFLLCIAHKLNYNEWC